MLSCLKAAIAVLSLCFLSLTYATPAMADGPVDTVCLRKTDSLGGKASFIVKGADAPAFDSAGFNRIPCPENIAIYITGLSAQCDKFEGLSPTGKGHMLDLYGLTVAAMCQPQRAWISSVQ